MKKSEHLVDLEVDERAILKWIFRNMTEDCELYLVQGMYSDGLLITQQRKFDFHKFVKFLD
jgi:predicted hydrolase (HD superfamily)